MLNQFGNNTPTQLHYDAGATEVFVDQFGVSIAATITSLTFNWHFPTSTQTITISGLSLSVATVFTWISQAAISNPIMRRFTTPYLAARTRSQAATATTLSRATAATIR